MRFKANKLFLALTFLAFCEIAVCYRNEVEITPAPIEEPTTKKSGGFFGGIKSFFRGTTTPAPEVTTTRAIAAVVPSKAPTLPPIVIPKAPLMPLGPRPDTPSSSPLAGNSHEPPQWPQVQPSTPSTPANARPQQLPSQQFPQNPQIGSSTFGSGQRAPSAGAPQPQLPPGFAPYRPKPLPSGVDLSYGGASSISGRPQSGPGIGLAPLSGGTSTTTTTTTQRPSQPQQPLNFDLRGGMGLPASTTTQRPAQPTKDDFPPLTPPRKPSIGAKEDFPALPAPKSPTPATPTRPSSPSAWNTPLTPAQPGAPLPFPSSVATPTPTPAGGNRVSFVPHSRTTTTVRPGFQNTGNSLATDDEIRELTETLYNKEVNSQLSLIQVNVQGKTRSIDSTDEAPQPLLEVDAKAFEAPTIAKMRLLFNNYEEDTLTNEYVTPNERKEENDFVDAVMATSVMRQAMQFLQNKGIVSPDPKTHRDLVKELWFTQYSRGSGKIGSSGFEHVFVNEVKNGTIIGLHNWVFFYDEEKAGRLDYKGYLNQLDLGTKGKVLKTRFTHNGFNKPVNTLFVGTSPELELALYTVCFQLRPDRTCPVQLGNSKFGIVTYSWRYRGKSLIGSAYPEI